MRAIACLALVATPLLAAAPAAHAQAVGSEFQINTYTTGYQGGYFAGGQHSVATDASGNFVVVWQSTYSSGSDAIPQSIQARRFNASGDPIGDDFQVNSFTTGSQLAPSVAAFASGGFVVAWTSYSGSSGSDTTGASIQLRRFDASGDPIGDDFQVNTFTPYTQRLPSLSADASGGFVVAWMSSSYGSSGSDTSGYAIRARRFGSSGAPIGDDFEVNTFTLSHQRFPSVATEGSGAFVVVWHSVYSSGSDSSSYSIQARRFNSSGVTIGADFQVNAFTTGGQVHPSVAAAAGGAFVVAWQSYGSAGSDTSGSSIQAHRLDSSGIPTGDDFQVNTFTSSYQSIPSVAVDGSGGFVVTWRSNGSAGSDTSGPSIEARRFDSTGTAVGDDFQVNTLTTGYQISPSIAAGPGGNFVTAWMSYAQDGSNWGVFGQRLQFSTTPTLAVDDVVVSESAGTATFTVSLSSASTNTVTVKYKTANGTALSGASKDYLPKALTTLTFAPGQTSKSVVVTIKDDSLDEDDEFFFLNLSAPSANATLGDSQGLGTIQDDDATPSLSITDATVTEGDSGTQMMTFTLSLSAASGRNVSVTAATANDSATAPSDFTAKTSSLAINAGMTSKTFSVTIKGDTADEPNESFFVDLSGETNATVADGQGVGTILNNDSLAGVPTVSVAADPNGPEGGTENFTVQLSGPTTQTVTVHYATANGTAMAGAAKDYLTKSGTATFTVGGSLSYAVQVTTNPDLLDEADETLFLNLSSPVHATIGDGQGVATIFDDDPQPSLSIGDPSPVTEGNSGTQNMIFTVTLSAASGQTVTVHYTTLDDSAQAPSDYNAKSGTLTFTSGQTSKTISVPIKGDTVAEGGDEVFHVTLDTPANASIGTGYATGTIIEDDFPKRVFVSSSTFGANFGGAIIADLLCQAFADGATLGGSWRAWVSDSTSSPSVRFTHSTLPYQRIDGTTIAANWAGLTSGTLVNGVATDENGSAVPSSEVWTATLPDGSYAGGSCNNFTDNSSGAPFAIVGISDQTNGSWTTAYLQFCDRVGLRLYCVEQ